MKFYQYKTMFILLVFTSCSYMKFDSSPSTDSPSVKGPDMAGSENKKNPLPVQDFKDTNQGSNNKVPDSNLNQNENDLAANQNENDSKLSFFKDDDEIVTNSLNDEIRKLKAEVKHYSEKLRDLNAKSKV